MTKVCRVSHSFIPWCFQLKRLIIDGLTFEVQNDQKCKIFVTQAWLIGMNRMRIQAYHYIVLTKSFPTIPDSLPQRSSLG